MTVNGTGFGSAATVQWTANGTTTPLPTTSVSSTQLLANVDSSLLTTPGTGSVAVTQVVHGSSQTSNVVPFTITPFSTTGPFIFSLSPNSVQAGSSSFTLTVNGTNLVPGATVQWTANGTTTPLPTSYLSINGSQQLLANVDSSLLTTPGTVAVTVTQPVNGSTLISNPLTFIITPSATTGPVIFSLSPSSAQVGSSAFTLTVDGANFVQGATVQWTMNPLTTSLPTMFVNSDELLASVPSSLLATLGTASVTVTQVSNGSSMTSNAAAFDITTFPTTGPFISSLSRNAVQEGSGSFALTVNGGGFGAGSTVQWTQNGSTTALETFALSSNQLLAVVPASLLAEE
jgi:hypothetical protein